MMIPVHNTTAMPIYVHGQMIPAGETRHFDASVVPPEYLPAEPEPVEAEPVVDTLAELLTGTVAEIVPQLDALGIEELERLGALEQTGQARKGVLGPIAEILLTRAGDPGASGGEDTSASITGLVNGTAADVVTDGVIGA